MDWTLFPPHFGRRVPLPNTVWDRQYHWISSQFEDECSADAIDQGNSRPDPNPLSPIIERFEEATNGRERRKIAALYLRYLCNGILGNPPETEIPTSTRFLAMGFDSMMATILRLRIRKDFGIDLTAPWIIETGTPDDCTDRIIRESTGTSRPGSKEPKTSTGTGAAENYPLSVGQSALWFLQKLHPTSTAYNQSIPLRIQKGTLEDWKRACQALVERHEILRTIYPESQESPVARILSSSVPDFTTQTFPDGRSVERAIAREHHQPFSLSDSPPVRFRWLCGPENDPILLITLHHIACDGWSNEIIQRDLAALARGESLDPVAFSYEQFSREQSAMLSSERGADLLRRWREILADPIPVLDLGADYARVSDSAAKGEILSIPLAPSLTSKLRDFAREHESTLQNTILAAFASLLQTLSRQNDCIIGCPVAAREAPELTETVGYFVNPLPIRIRMDGHTTFRELIAIAQTAMKRSLELQDYPFPQLVKDLNAPRIPGRSPIFDASFNFVRTLGQRHEELESFSIPQAAGKFDLTLNVVENGRHPSFSFAYRSDLFRTDTIERFGFLLTQIIDAGITAPEMSVGEALSHSIQDDQRSLISGAESPITRTVIDDLFQWAKATPSQIALVAGERSITYGELGRQVLSWARWLQSEGVRAEVPVAIIANRTAETWIAYLGVLASGGTLLPLDPQAPAAGRKEILQRTTPPLLLAENANAFSGIPARTVEILNGPPVTDSESPWTPPTLAGTAYILFTSGSTGTPKGVSVGHSALANYAASLQEILQTHPGAHFGHISPLTTDLGHSAWVGALTTGGCLHLIPDRVRLHPSLFAAYIKDHPLDYLKSTPSHCSALLEPNGSGTVEDFPIKSFILGGERVSSEWLARIKELGSECSIIHHYGPTEATIGVLVANLNSHDNVSTKALPLRRPTLNTTIALVNEAGCVVPRGVCGELTISGLCLSDGYIDGTTTAPGPLELSQITENGVYRTGDLARMSLNGDIEIIGRLDRQLKLHGIRIEPGHLEALLQQLSSVSDSRIFIHGDQICACIVSQDPHGVEVAGEHLKRHLPPSLVPTRWYQCEQLPLTRNGKLDTDALTETRSFSTEPKNRGQDPLMATVLRIWKDALQRPELRSDENFFDAGGHSLLAIRLLALLFEQTGHTLSIADLLNHPTAEKTSAFLRAKGSEPSITVPVVQLKDGRGPLQILIPGAGGSLLYFQPLLEKISEGPVIGLPGLIGHKNAPKSVDELASYYLENLSPEQLDQPIALLGHSFGGLLAWALADRLQASGATVRHVGIIDNPAVGSGKGREYTSWDHVDWLRHIALRIGKLHGTTLQLPESINRELSPEESDRSFAAHLRDHGFLPQGTSDEALAQYIRTYRANALAAALYEPARIKNPPFQLHLFLAADQDHELDEDRSEMSEWLGWEKVYPRSPHLYTLPGTHLSLLAEPNVERLAAEWNKLIAPHPHGR